MRLVKKDLVTLLRASDDITEIVGTAIFSGLAPISLIENGSPFITYVMSNVDPLKTHDMQRTVETLADSYEFVIYAVAENGDVASNLAEAIVLALDGEEGETSQCFLWQSSGPEIVDYKGDNSGKVIYQIPSYFITRRSV